MQAEHQVVEKGVFFILAIKLDESLGARWGEQSLLSVRTAGSNRFRRTLSQTKQTASCV